MSTQTYPNVKELAYTYLYHYPNRPTIVFLHDSLGCMELWRDFPNEIASSTKYNVLIYDRQGYGKSGTFSIQERDEHYLAHEADCLRMLLQHCNIDTAILFGHSDGGSIALIAAAKYPESIIGIITEGAHVFVEDITLQGINEAIDAYKTTSLKAKLEKYHGTKTEAMFWAWAKTWNEPFFKSWGIETYLPLIKCPSLIIQGELDEYGTLLQVEKIVNAAQNATALIIPDVKHTPHKEVPEEIITAVKKFISNLKL